MQRWITINVAERHIRDGMIRGTGDPDSYGRPGVTDPQAPQAAEWRRQWQAQREWFTAYEHYRRALFEQQQRHGRR
jgi:hypothetical protein